MLVLVLSVLSLGKHRFGWAVRRRWDRGCIDSAVQSLWFGWARSKAAPRKATATNIFESVRGLLWEQKLRVEVNWKMFLFIEYWSVSLYEFFEDKVCSSQVWVSKSWGVPSHWDALALRRWPGALLSTELRCLHLLTSPHISQLRAFFQSVICKLGQVRHWENGKLVRQRYRNT